MVVATMKMTTKKSRKRKKTPKMAESLSLSKSSQVEFKKSVAIKKRMMAKERKHDNAIDESSNITRNSGNGGDVIYLGHIPHGFYENEMESYFSQFGTVTNVSLARSRVTGHSKGFGFIQFESEDVAKIAAETMNNYLMFEHILKSNVVPPENVSPDLFKRDSRRLKSRPKYHKLNAFNKQNSDDEIKLSQQRLEKQFRSKAKILNDLGITFDVNLLIPPKFQPTKTLEKEHVMLKKNKNQKKTENKKIKQKAKKNKSPDEALQKSRLSDPGTPNSLNSSEHYLEIDPSDDEITFKLPPKTRMITKKKRKLSNA